MTQRARARVLVTRAAEDAGRWLEALRAEGYEADALPCFETRVIDSPRTRSRLAEALAGARWLALTSARGVEACEQLLEGALPEMVAVAAVGPRTAEAARSALGRVDLVSDKGDGEDLALRLAEIFASSDPPRRVVCASADRARRHLEKILEPRGVEVVRIPVYRTLVMPPRDERALLSTSDADAILIASPSAVEGLLNQVRVDPAIAIVTIGPTSTAAARERGLAVVAQAATPDLPSMMRALSGALEETPGGKRS